MMLLDVDPSLVRPGWGPLVVFVLLAVAMVLLFWSMRRQFRKINVPHSSELSESRDSSRPRH